MSEMSINFADKKWIAWVVLAVLYAIALGMLYQKKNAAPTRVPLVDHRQIRPGSDKTPGRTAAPRSGMAWRPVPALKVSPIVEPGTSKGDCITIDVRNDPDDAVYPTSLIIDPAHSLAPVASGQPGQQADADHDHAEAQIAGEAIANGQALARPARDHGEYVEYVVRQGDTLWSIVEKSYNLLNQQEVKRMVKKVIDANPWLKQNPNLMSAGKVLLLPVPRKKSAVDTPSRSVPYHTQPWRAAAESVPASVGKTKNGGAQVRIHEVCQGDTLYSLAEKYYHDQSKWRWIYQANNHINPNSLACGTRLQIPLYRGDN